jgi:hypothetical protein
MVGDFLDGVSLTVKFKCVGSQGGGRAGEWTKCLMRTDLGETPVDCGIPILGRSRIKVPGLNPWCDKAQVLIEGADETA